MMGRCWWPGRQRGSKLEAPPMSWTPMSLLQVLTRAWHVTAPTKCMILACWKTPLTYMLDLSKLLDVITSDCFAGDLVETCIASHECWLGVILPHAADPPVLLRGHNHQKLVLLNSALLESLGAPLPQPLSCALLARTLQTPSRRLCIIADSHTHMLGCCVPAQAVCRVMQSLACYPTTPSNVADVVLTPVHGETLVKATSTGCNTYSCISHDTCASRHAYSLCLQHSHQDSLTRFGLLSTLLTGPESVQTPREVYDELKKEGYRVQYYRLPLTDGEAPKETIFDVFYSHVKNVPPSDALIFNCQMGGGRTTTGMVIGCLIRMHTSGRWVASMFLWPVVCVYVCVHVQTHVCAVVSRLSSVLAKHESLRTLQGTHSTWQNHFWPVKPSAPSAAALCHVVLYYLVWYCMVLYGILLFCIISEYDIVNIHSIMCELWSAWCRQWQDDQPARAHQDGGAGGLVTPQRRL